MSTESVLEEKSLRWEGFVEKVRLELLSQKRIRELWQKRINRRRNKEEESRKTGEK